MGGVEKIGVNLRFCAEKRGGGNPAATACCCVSVVCDVRVYNGKRARRNHPIFRCLRGGRLKQKGDDNKWVKPFKPKPQNNCDTSLYNIYVYITAIIIIITSTTLVLFVAVVYFHPAVACCSGVIISRRRDSNALR